MKEYKYQIEEHIEQMTSKEKASFFENVLNSRRMDGSFILGHRSRLYRIRKAKMGDKVNATIEQLRIIIEEINKIFPTANLCFSNIEKVAQATAA